MCSLVFHEQAWKATKVRPAEPPRRPRSADRPPPLLAATRRLFLFSCIFLFFFYLCRRLCRPHPRPWGRHRFGSVSHRETTSSFNIEPPSALLGPVATTQNVSASMFPLDVHMAVASCCSF